MSQTHSSVVFHSSQATPLGRVLLVGCHLELHPVPSMPMRVWEIYSLVYVLAGTGCFLDIEGRELPLEAGDLMLMFPGHGYRYLPEPAHPWSELYLQFDGPLFDVWRDAGVITPAQPVLHLEPVEYWRQQLQQVAANPAADGPAQMLARVMTLQAVLAEIVSHAAHLTQVDRGWVLQAQALLNTVLLTEDVDWPALASALHLSADRFRKKFHALSGVSPAQYLAHRRCDEASRLLQQTTLSLCAIAEVVGFCDDSHFSRRFKERTGLSPSDYRAVCQSQRLNTTPSA